MEEPKDNRPLSFKLVQWWGYTFSVMFLLYGGVKVILACLDHKYNDIEQPIAFLVIGLILIAPAIAYKEQKPWGYWGLVVINGLVVILALIGVTNPYNLVPLFLSAVALWMLFRAETKNYVFGRG